MKNACDLNFYDFNRKYKTKIFTASPTGNFVDKNPSQKRVNSFQDKRFLFFIPLQTKLRVETRRLGHDLNLILQLGKLQNRNVTDCNNSTC